MFNTSLATHVSSCANRQQLLVPPLQPCRTRLRRHGALSLQPSLRDQPLLSEIPDVNPDNSLQQRGLSSAPQSVSAVTTSKGKAAARQLLPRAAWLVKSAKARMSEVKTSQNLLPLLGAALLLGVACCVVPVAGILACVLLLSGIAIMETFWKKLMPDHLASIKSARAVHDDATKEADLGQALSAASAMGRKLMTHAPSEVSAWLHTARHDIWGALWQPLLDYREEWQAAMTQNGPYAWAYDASGISVGQLAPEFTGMQVFADPSTGAIAAVEADMSLNTSTAPDSVVLEVLARGPIGKYAVSLEAVRVTGRIRLVPVPKHNLLLVQYAHQPVVQIELSTAYPAMLPHNRAKLLQVAEIEDLLHETLQGVLGSPDVLRLNYQAEFPINMQYAAESAIRAAVACVSNSRSRLTAALQQRMPLWAPVAAAETKSDSTDIHQQAAHSFDAHSQDQLSTTASGFSVGFSDSVSSNTQHAAPPFSMNGTSMNEPSTNPRNSVAESAVLALAAQQAAWRQQKPQERSFSTILSTSMQNPNEMNMVPAAASGRSTTSSTSNTKQSRSYSKGSHRSSVVGARWQLSSTYSEAMECWTASGITARLSAAAAEAAATASPTRQDAPAPGATAAAAALEAQVSTGRLLLDPVQAYTRGRLSSSSQHSSRVSYAAGRQHTSAQPGRAPGSYAVLSTTSAAISGTCVGLGSLLYDFGSPGASCVLAAPSSHGVKNGIDGVPATCSSSAADSSAQAGKGSSMRDTSTAAAAVATSSSGSPKAIQVNSNVPTRPMQPQVGSAVPSAATGAFQAFYSEPAASPSSLSAGAGAVAMALPAPRPRVSWVSIAASVSVVILGSGVLLGSF